MTKRKATRADPDDEFATCPSEMGELSTHVGFPAGDSFATIAAGDGRDTSNRPIRYDALVLGDQVGDFRIQRLLGRGSFGAVYLARELTLDRLVAVKVVLPEGRRATAGEGRSLARLKHPGIVGVYGEAHDRVSGCSLLWMQFVDGSDLATLINRLHTHSGKDWNETDLVSLLSPEGDSSEYESEKGQSRGSLETVCRIGQRLAEAISHAHRSGITHRDIKPANILMQSDGMPLLADFNLAGNDSDGGHKQISGGTIAYMPPEQFEQLLGKDVTFDARRADIYSLGVVLWELACGRRPHADAESKVESSGGHRLLEYLRLRQEELPTSENKISIGLELILLRAMSVDPENRYPSARAMATGLGGLAELQRARQRAPEVAGLRKFVRRNLIWVILIGGILPHFAASGLQSSYNQIWIGSSGAFVKAFIAYNIVVYPACIGWLAWNLWKFAQGYRRVVARESIPRAQLRKLRRRLLRLPRQFMIASAVGWFPGIVLFPWLLGIFGEPPSRSHWFHYGISFAIAGLIATTYSYAFVLFVAVCHGFGTCWQTASRYRQRARYELAGMENRIGRVSILVGVLPLAAAVLLLAIAIPSLNPQDANHLGQVRGLHQLVIALIVFGAIGQYVVQTASARLIRVVRALTLADE